MTRLLLDTHAFLWWLAGDESLSMDAREAISAELDPIFVSAASIWEIATKHRLGKLPAASAIVGDLAGVIESQGFVGRLRFVTERQRPACRGHIAILSIAC
jgi:PIN domain nuclease of toxin-antitoxin system